jgi:hypothetical protein
MEDLKQPISFPKPRGNANMCRESSNARGMQGAIGELKVDNGHTTFTPSPHRSPRKLGGTTSGIVYIQSSSSSNFRSDSTQLFDTKGLVADCVNNVTAVTKSEVRLLNTIFRHLSLCQTGATTIICHKFSV